MASVVSLEKKVLDKVESKYKGGVSKKTLERLFNDADKDGDSMISQAEFFKALEIIGAPLRADEGEFLFRFWDTQAEQQEAVGFVSVPLIVQDLLTNVPEYSTGFNSGQEAIKTNKGAKGNLPSQRGGIFSGGSYAADAASERGDVPPRATYAPAPPAVDMYEPSTRPKGNQPSVPGGIFGAEESERRPQQSASSNRDGNKSNRSSIEGGIFGASAPAEPAPAKKRYSNQSSIQGGIFGTG